MRGRRSGATGAVVALAVGLSALSFATSGAAAAPQTRAAVVGFPTADDAEQSMFTWLNQERTSRGLAPLVRSEVLDRFGQEWSDFMAAGGCLARDGRRLCHRTDLRLVATTAFPGTWSRAGENVGLVPFGGTLESLHQAFMDSMAHRSNVLLPTYSDVGIGISFDADGTLYVTYEFIAQHGGAGTPPPGLPTPPAGATEEDSLLLWINDLRAKQGLGPLTRHPVLDREAEAWSTQMASGQACTGNATICHRKDMSSVTKTAVGTRGSRWWSENVGMRNPADVGSQFLGFSASAPHRANMLRPEINLVGIGYFLDPATGRAYTTFEFVAAKQPDNTLPPGGNVCGWVQSTIAKGAKCPYVRTLQCALAAAGVYVGPIDGLFDADVVAAVKAFQGLNGVKRPSGRADLKTRRLLGIA